MEKGAVERKEWRQYSLLTIKGESLIHQNTPEGKVISILGEIIH